MHGESNPNYRHGHKSKNGRASPTYNSWRMMKTRCQNSNFPYYKDYGGRGIKVCERWMNFENFLTDMGERPENTTLDRINNDGNYEPGNCRWATRKEQRRNQRDRKDQCLFIAINLQGTMIISNKQRKFARQYGLDPSGVNHCLNGKHKTHKGWRFKRIPSISGEPLFIPMKVECYA